MNAWLEESETQLMNLPHYKVCNGLFIVFCCEIDLSFGFFFFIHELVDGLKRCRGRVLKFYTAAFFLRWLA